MAARLASRLASRLSLSSLQGVSKRRWAAIILGTGGEDSESLSSSSLGVYVLTGAGYVGMAVYRWQRRHKEHRKKDSGESRES